MFFELDPGFYDYDKLSLTITQKVSSEIRLSH